MILPQPPKHTTIQATQNWKRKGQENLTNSTYKHHLQTHMTKQTSNINNTRQYKSARLITQQSDNTQHQNKVSQTSKNANKTDKNQTNSTKSIHQIPSKHPMTLHCKCNTSSINIDIKVFHIHQHSFPQGKRKTHKYNKTPQPIS